MKAALMDTLGEEKTMKAAQNRSIKATAKTGWLNEWNKGQTDARQLRNMTRRPNKTPGAKIYQQSTNRKHIAWIARFRTGHVSLNKYLHRFGHVDDPICECGEGHGIVAYYLLKMRDL
jgi:hypothetical protein